MLFLYYDELDKEAKGIYDAKLDLVGLNECPYRQSAQVWNNDPSRWPSVDFGDIYYYLIDTPGAFTRESMKHCKQLEAHKYFKSGLVDTVYRYKPKGSTHIILKAQVNPSQELHDEQYCPWIAVASDGQVIASHCNCVAGLTDSCSHIAAVLFKVEAAIRLGYTTQPHKAIRCKGSQSFLKNVTPAPISKINFYSKKERNAAKNRQNKRKPIEKSTKEEQERFLSSFNKLENKPVGLSLFSGYSESFHWKEPEGTKDEPKMHNPGK